MTCTYYDIAHIVDYEVTPALGDFADCYDREAIARECWEYDEERQGFVEREGADFWEAAQRFDLVGDAAEKAWRGDGFYSVGYTDGGMPCTSDGPVWVETLDDLRRLLGCAYQCATGTHAPVVDYVGLEL